MEICLIVTQSVIPVQYSSVLYSATFFGFVRKIMCKPWTLFYLGRYGEIYSSLCWSGSEHVLGTRLGLLGRGVGVAARPRYRLREAHRDADNVGVLRVFPLGQ